MASGCCGDGWQEGCLDYMIESLTNTLVVHAHPPSCRLANAIESKHRPNSSYWECEELGLNSCSSSTRSWCNLGVSVGVGGGFGLLGIAAFGWGLCTCTDKRGYASDRTDGALAVFLGLVWCLGWSSGVVIWGGVRGATIVGIMWGAGVLAGIATCIGINRHAREQ